MASNRVLSAREIQECSVIAEYRTYPQSICEKRTVLAIVGNINCEAGSRAQPLPDRFNGVRVRFRPLEKSTISPDGFRSGIPSLALEFLAHEDHRVIGQGGIRYHHAHFDFVVIEKCACLLSGKTMRVHLSCLQRCGPSEFAREKPNSIPVVMDRKGARVALRDQDGRFTDQSIVVQRFHKKIGDIRPRNNAVSPGARFFKDLVSP